MAAMSKIAVVTGASQGLGFALVEGLAQRLDPSDVVYLTGRDVVRRGKRPGPNSSIRSSRPTTSVRPGYCGP